MLFSGIEFVGKPPFKTIYVHPTILDSSGKKMSKSKGNIVNPMKLVNQYGIDAARFGLVWQAMSTQDIRWSEDPFRAGKKFLNKIWNSARLVLSRVGPEERKLRPPKKVTLAENAKILEDLGQMQKELKKHFEELEFGQALHVAYDFYWHTFCDVFLEAAKKDDSKETRDILFYVLASLLKELNPFIPFITEYIWGMLPIEGKRLLMVEEI